MKNLRSTGKVVYNLNYHIIFVTKYRRKVLTPIVEIKLKEILYQLCLNNNWILSEIEVMPDHIHLFLRLTPNDNIPSVIQILKGTSSKKLREDFLYLKRLPSLWTRSYYIESIGCISEHTIRKYIQSQKNH